MSKACSLLIKMTHGELYFRRRAYAALLMAALVILSLGAGIFPPVLSAGTELFPLSAAPDNAFRFRVRDAAIYVENLPSDTRFDWLMLQLESEDGSRTEQLWTSRNAEGGVRYPLDSIADGVYYMQLYTSEEEYSTYVSYIHKRMVCVELSGGTACFRLSPVYAGNESLYAVKRRDAGALEYYSRPSAGIESDDAQIIALAQSITEGIRDPYRKLQAVHDWVSANIWYDYDVLYGKADYGSQSALDTYISGRGVCQGYASLTAALLRASGIPTKLVSGYALGISSAGAWTEALVTGDEQNHAWNEAYVNGRWVILDTTWDSGNEYRDRQKTVNGGLRGHLYFDPSLEIFSGSHRIHNYDESTLPPAAAAPTVSAVLVDGRTVSFDAYNIADNNYFKLRDIAYVLNGTGKSFEVQWIPGDNSIRLTGGAAYTAVGGELEKKSDGVQTALYTRSKVYLDGTEVRLTAYNIGGNNYFKLRDIGILFDFDVSWDGASGTILIDTAKPYSDD